MGNSASYSPKNLKDKNNVSRQKLDEDENCEESASAQTLALTSLFNNKFLVDQNVCTISILTQGIHAFLVIESCVPVPESSPAPNSIKLQRIVTRADFHPKPGANILLGQGEVRINVISENLAAGIPVEETEDFQKYCVGDTKKYPCWQKSADLGQKLLDVISEEHKIQGTNYSVSGESSGSSIQGPADGECHNCISWCQRMLQKVGINAGSDDFALLKIPHTIVNKLYNSAN